MKTKFTPGPWEAHLGLDYFNIYSKSGSCVVPDSRCNPENDRDAADAYLLASAPDLYEALEDAIRWLDGVYGQNLDLAMESMPVNCMPRSEMRRALARAQGEIAREVTR